MDNRTAIAYVNKMGGPTLSPLCILALQTWEWCLKRNITLHAEYLPGRDNIEADWESRHQRDSSDWQLLPLVFRTLNNQLGPFSIDLFACRTNAQLEHYYSWKPDPAAIAVDAFSVSWAQERPYITRNAITFLYVLLECFKWISMYFKANNITNAYNFHSL